MPVTSPQGRVSWFLPACHRGIRRLETSWENPSRTTSGSWFFPAPLPATIGRRGRWREVTKSPYRQVGATRYGAVP